MGIGTFKQIITISLFLLPFIGIAQDDTYNFENRSENALELDESLQGEIMVIPFELRLYYSFFDKQFVTENNLTVEQVREKFRQGLVDQLTLATSKRKKATFPSKDGSFNEPELSMIHKSLTYTNANVPVKEEEKSKAEQQLDKLKSKLKKPKKEKRTGTYIENGQIVTVRDTKEKYTKSSVKDGDFLFVLNKKYASEVYIFINKLEILYPSEMNQTAIQSGTYPREIRVHYTIIDNDGKEMNGGLAKSTFPNQLNDIDQIIADHFPPVIDQIISDLPVEEEEEMKE